MAYKFALHTLRIVAVLWLLGSLTPSVHAWGEEKDETTDLFSAVPQAESTTSRISKPLSLTAENTTVITSADIAAMNAHSLADILDMIPGVQQQHLGGPGVSPYTFIQSSASTHVQVLLDGVSITNLDSNFSDSSAIPAQIIERIEIVKGPASTAWGQVMGGVINVITKSPGQRLAGGSATASIGERTTADTRLELTGSTGKLGYYLSGGYLDTNGLLPNRQAYTSQMYTKLTYDLPNRGLLWGTFGYTHANRGTSYHPEDFLNFKENEIHDNRIASLGMRYNLTPRLELELLGRHFSTVNWKTFSHVSGTPWDPVVDGPANGKINESTTGAGVKLSWRGDNHLLVAGGDFNHIVTKTDSAPDQAIVDRWSLFLNDTLTLGAVSINPGVRLDHTWTNGDLYAASLGMTWQLTDSTILRAYTGRGHGMPETYPPAGPAAKIWATQIGAESTAIPHLWLKGTLFRNQTWNNSDQLNGWGSVERRMALGAEVEARTTPLFNTSLGAGYTFTDTTRTIDSQQVHELPRHTLQLSLRYDDKTFRGWLNGRHVYWNSPTDYNGKYGGLIWDLHLGATLLKKQDTSLELFFSGRNLFNSPHYYWEYFPTTGRWFEGGVRVRF